VLSSERFDAERTRFRVSNAVRRPDGVHVRIVQDTIPFDGAERVEPNLEDAFLHVMSAAA